MRHRRRGRKLGRNPSHQRALLRSLASELILTERDPDDPMFDSSSPLAPSPPKVRGRIITTLAKAKEVRPLVERCVTIACKAQAPLETAATLESDGDRGSSEWTSWRKSDRYGEWNQAMAPALAARRRLIQLLGRKEAVDILLDEIAPRFVDRPGGYTRIVKLAQPRLGDAGERAILEFVGRRDRAAKKSERPSFETVDETEETKPVAATSDAPTSEAPASEEATSQQDAPATDEGAEEKPTS